MGIFNSLREKMKTKKKKRQIRYTLKKVKNKIIASLKNRETADSFTKRKVNLILNHAIIWVYLTYGLAYLGRESIAENLAVTIVKVIIYTIMSYLCKSLFENVFKYGSFRIENPYISEETTVEETSNTEVTETSESESTEGPEEECAG